jgi:hypothetical protein
MHLGNQWESSDGDREAIQAHSERWPSSKSIASILNNGIELVGVKKNTGCHG